MGKSDYQYDEYYCFNKQAFEGRLEKQLGDFGEQLIMTVLGRMKKYKVFHVDHEGADLIASEVEPSETDDIRRYAISVKAHQFGVDESQNYVFKRNDQIKLTKFAEDFKAIPVVAEVLVSKDFSFVDIFLIRLKDFMDLADESLEKEKELVAAGLLNTDAHGRAKVVEHLYPQLAIRWDSSKGLSLNNYVLNGRKKVYESNVYTEFLYNNPRIQHMRIGMENRLDGTSLGGSLEKEIDAELLSQASDKDGNQSRQLGDFGEHVMAFAFSYMKKYKVALVDHVGIDLIAAKPGARQKPYAISVKTMFKSGINYKYKFDDIRKIVTIARELDFIPAVAYILPREKANPGIFDFYFMTVEMLIQYARDTEYYLFFNEKEATVENYFKLAKERFLQLELNVENNEAFREYVKSHPKIEHMEMHFPVQFE